MLAQLQAGGHELILARRAARTHSPFRVLGAKLYFGLLSRLTEEQVDGSYGTFSILSRKVVDAFLQFSERERHYLFIIRWLGFSSGTYEYEHQQRHCGTSAYSLRRLIRHAFEGIFFQATVLLRWIVMSGLIFAALGVLLGLYFIFQYFTHATMPGWTSLIVLMLFSTGAILTSLGIIGLYVGKIFEQTKGRPLYTLDLITRKSPL